jgi:formate dehydrogenase maturation protein FdhE
MTLAVSEPAPPPADDADLDLGGLAELWHEHLCPVCGARPMCFVMACRGVDRYQERCWPCRRAGRGVE